MRGFVRSSVRRLVGRLVGWSVVIEFESVKTRISAPAHPSATGIGRVSSLVDHLVHQSIRIAKQVVHEHLLVSSYNV